MAHHAQSATSQRGRITRLSGRPDLAASLLFAPEEKIEDQPHGVRLLVGSDAGGVVVFIVGIDLDLLAQRKYPTSRDGGRAPLVIAAVVIELSAGIDGWVVGAQRNRLLEGQPVAITPGGIAIGEVDFHTI